MFVFIICRGNSNYPGVYVFLWQAMDLVDLQEGETQIDLFFTRPAFYVSIKLGLCMIVLLICMKWLQFELFGWGVSTSGARTSRAVLGGLKDSWHPSFWHNSCCYSVFGPCEFEKLFVDTLRFYPYFAEMVFMLCWF